MKTKIKVGDKVPDRLYLTGEKVNYMTIEGINDGVLVMFQNDEYSSKGRIMTGSQLTHYLNFYNYEI